MGTDLYVSDDDRATHGVQHVPSLGVSMEDNRRGPLSPRQRRKHALCVTENHVSLPGVSTSGHLLGENGIFLTTAQGTRYKQDA